MLIFARFDGTCLFSDTIYALEFRSRFVRLVSESKEWGGSSCQRDPLGQVSF
jgi:hypothetical protein